MVVAPEGTFFQDPARRVDQFVRAYSSIGQSPRLITGPFLVRTQVGPPLLTAAEQRGVPTSGLARSAVLPPKKAVHALAARPVVESSALSPLQGAS